MFKLVLIGKYLRRRLTPLFAAAAVMLCTAMVIIVISVMDGFFQMMQTAARRLTADVVVENAVGFSEYEALVERLEAQPQIAAATPMIRAYGLINIDVPGRDTPYLQPAEFLGIRPRGYDRVTNYGAALHWTPRDVESAFDPDQPPSTDLSPEAVERARRHYLAVLESGSTLDRIDPLDGALPMVPGIEIYPGNLRDEQGRYDFAYSGVGRPAVVTVVPLSEKGVLGAYEPIDQRFIIANEFKSGLYDVDSGRAFLPFEVLQTMMKMEPRQVQGFDPDTGESTGQMVDVPGRAHQVMVRGAPGVPLASVAEAVSTTVAHFRDRHEEVPYLTVETWRQRHRVLLDAVRNEKGMITFLFVVISVVAFLMIATTFYNIVLEKTRDIGVLRAIGASRLGIANIFLGYALAIGIIGTGIGFALASAIVTHLNEIQQIIKQWTGWQMWNPQTYFFDRIPDQVDLYGAMWIVLGGIVASVLGAMIPAVVAARQDPVQALRYE